MSRALITGSSGQDGRYLTRLLEREGCDVVGVGRGDVDLTDREAVRALLRETRPREVYNLAAPTFVPQSWEEPDAVAAVGCVGMAVLLDAVVAVDPSIRVLQASSAAVFGRPVDHPQREDTPYRPLTPYGAAKAYADFMVRAYRDRHGLHASCAILFNHESPLRPQRFLSAKVAHGVQAIAAGEVDELVLGNLDARRDWGYAADYVEAMRAMVRADEPGDYVIATGETHTVAELVELAFAHVGLAAEDYVRVDPELVRDEGEGILVGDASRARELLGWAPTVSFDELVRLLVDAAARPTG